MGLLIKYVEYDEKTHQLKITGHHFEKNQDSIFLSVASKDKKPDWLTEKEYQACLYLFACIHAIQQGEYVIKYGEYFKRNDLKLVGFTLESKYISTQNTMLEYLFIGRKFGAVRFRDVPSMMVNIPYFNVLEESFLKKSPHRLRLLT